MINRRQLLKYLLQAGIFAGAGPVVSSRLQAASDSYSGPLWIIVNAQGGWDVTSFCDPKGYNGVAGKNSPDRINNYDSADILQAGNVPYAPSPDSFRPGQINFDPNLYSVTTFFQKYYHHMLVLNGIDCQTNSHASGQMYNMSGHMIPGYPVFSALLSAVSAPDRALSFLSNGGYASSGGLITPIKLNSPAMRALSEIAYPNRSSIPRSAASRLYLPSAVEQLITNASNQRHQEMLVSQNLPRIRKSLTELVQSRQSLSSLQALADNLEQIPLRPESDFNGRKKAYRIYQQGRMALAAYQQGVASSVNVHLNGFDTHTNHDEKHYPLLMDLLQGVDAIIDEATSRGLENKIVLVMLSDFGRRNKYNNENGKDHWPISSAIVLGNQFQRVAGNKVIGQTSDQHKALAVDPISLIADTAGTNPQAVKLTPAHLHMSLRRLAAIDRSPVTMRYALNGQELALF